jgi:hypothetical protein
MMPIYATRTKLTRVERRVRQRQHQLDPGALDGGSRQLNHRTVCGGEHRLRVDRAQVAASDKPDADVARAGAPGRRCRRRCRREEPSAGFLRRRDTARFWLRCKPAKPPEDPAAGRRVGGAEHRPRSRRKRREEQEAIGKADGVRRAAAVAEKRNQRALQRDARSGVGVVRVPPREPGRFVDERRGVGFAEVDTHFPWQRIRSADGVESHVVDCGHAGCGIGIADGSADGRSGEGGDERGGHQLDVGEARVRERRREPVGVDIARGDDEQESLRQTEEAEMIADGANTNARMHVHTTTHNRSRVMRVGLQWRAIRAGT